METSFLSPNTCGFAKVAALQAEKQVADLKKADREGNFQFKSRKLQHRFTTFCGFFKEHSEAFAMEKATFNKRLPALQGVILKWNHRRKGEPDKFLSKFSTESWQQLSAVKKRGHSLTNCKGCHLDYRSIQALFPVRSPRLKGKGKENPCLVANPLAKTVKHAPKGAVKRVTKTIYSKLNLAFKEWAGVTFSEALCNLPVANLAHKMTKLQKKQERRNNIREVKKEIEKKWEKASLLR